MRLTGKFVLPEDAVLQPATELGEEFRRSSGAEDGDFALSRKNVRSYSKIVDADAASLIGQFSKPTTIAAAVARFSRGQGGDHVRRLGRERGPDPQQTLEDAIPLLRSLLEAGLLVSADSPAARQISGPLAAGTVVDGWTVARCLQSLEDTEVYQVRDDEGHWAAMKIGREADAAIKRMLEREVHCLGEAAGTSVPKLSMANLDASRPYLVIDWIYGVDAEAAAEEIRGEGGFQVRRDLHRLGAAVLEAYAGLHERGLLHGDIHPRNLLVDRRGSVTLIDFGFAAKVGEPSDVGRGGVSFFLEPEFAEAALRHLPPPEATLAGEQYSIAALLYLLLTGSHRQDFALEREKMLGQIAAGTTVSFAQRGIEPWPDVESPLARALNVNPDDRFPSIREFAEAWRRIVVPSQADNARAERSPAVQQIQSDLLSRSALAGEWMRHGFPLGERLSAFAINSGGAGLGFALSRIASATDDGELLAVADAWATRSARSGESPLALELPSMKPQNAGPKKPQEARPKDQIPSHASLHHELPGIYVAEALVAAARGDLAVQCRATADFIGSTTEALDESGAKLDLTLGFAGALLGSAFLMDSIPDSELSSPVVELKSELKALGDKVSAKLWTALDTLAPIGEPSGLVNTAVAHGWAGILYASLCWRSATGEGLPGSLRDRLEQLAARAAPIGRGLHWPWQHQPPISGWCNGSAGFVFLWTEAYQAMGDIRFLDYAEGAAQSTWETPSQLPSLCCGLAGQAYALLNFHRHSGDSVWLRRATKLASWAAEAAASQSSESADSAEMHSGSLYNGIAGIAVLVADLEHPLDARMPFFERD